MLYARGVLGRMARRVSGGRGCVGGGGGRRGGDDDGDDVSREDATVPPLSFKKVADYCDSL